MIKEKLDHIALSFYLVTGSSREPHTKNKKKKHFCYFESDWSKWIKTQKNKEKNNLNLIAFYIESMKDETFKTGSQNGLSFGTRNSKNPHYKA